MIKFLSSFLCKKLHIVDDLRTDKSFETLLKREKCCLSLWCLWVICSFWMFLNPLVRTLPGVWWSRTLCLNWTLCINLLLRQLWWGPLVLRLFILRLSFGLVLLILHNSRQFIYWHLIKLGFGKGFDQKLCSLILIFILTFLDDGMTLVTQLVEGRD